MVPLEETSFCGEVPLFQTFLEVDPFCCLKKNKNSFFRKKKYRLLYVDTKPGIVAVGFVFSDPKSGNVVLSTDFGIDQKVVKKTWLWNRWENLLYPNL